MSGGDEMMGPVTSDLTEVIRLIQGEEKVGYVTREFLEKICLGRIGMITTLVDSGFLIEKEGDKYGLTRKLLNYDPNRQSTVAKYDDLWLQKWGSTSSLV